MRLWRRTFVRNNAPIRPHRTFMMSSEDRNYDNAIKFLNTLQSNASVLNAIRQSGRGMNKQAIPEMIDWCTRVGYEPSSFNRLNAIHIAGTKGKGSTSAFISSILAQYLGKPGSLIHKIGLYTSPHLRFVRERIQINNEPLSEATFARYFFSTWDRLEASARAKGEPAGPCVKPVYFRYLTLMALHAYMSESVDTAVVECGIGGEYDSTNILQQPTVIGITNLGIDHTAMLGETIEEIAWHKAGIMKAGAVAYTVEQPEAAMAVLRARAVEKRVELRVVRRHPDVENLKLGLAADFQKINASLAIEIVAEHLKVIGYGDVGTDLLTDEFVRGLKEVRWGGRCETRIEGEVGWHLDGGHTLESINVAAEWFAECVLELSDFSSTLTPPRILIFNQQTRAGPPLLRKLHTALSEKLVTPHPFTDVIFCSNITFASGYRPDLVSMNVDAKDVDELKVQRELETGWQVVDGAESKIHIVRTIEDAVTLARKIAGTWTSKEGDTKGVNMEGQVKVLVTGSLHLVGGALEVLDSRGGASRVS